jgi:hypothetical protein
MISALDRTESSAHLLFDFSLVEEQLPRCISITEADLDPL